MKEVNKTDNTTQAFWVGFGKLSVMSISLISAIILSRYFDKENYGLFLQISYVYSMLVFVFSAGLPRVYSYYLPRYNLKEGKSIVKKISRLLFILGIIFSLFLFFLSGVIADILNTEKLELGLKIFSPVPMFLLPALGIEGIFSTYKKTIYLAVYNILTRIVFLLLIVLPVIFYGNNYIYAIYGWVFASFITFIVAYFFKTIPFRGVKQLETSLKFREIFGYSLPLVYASMWGITIKASNQFFISRFFGVEVFAEFTNGYRELPFVGVITLSASVVLMPVFSKMVHQKKEVKNFVFLWNSVIKKSALILYPIIIFVIFNAKPIIALLYSEKYINSTIYFQIHIFSSFFNIIIFAPLIFALGATKFYANVHAIFAILAWVGGYSVLLIFNSPVAIAFLSSILVIIKTIVFFKFISQKLNESILKMIPFRFLLKLLLHTIIIIIFTLIISHQVVMNSFLLILILNFMIYLTLLISTSVLFKINYILPFYPILKRFLPSKMFLLLTK